MKANEFVKKFGIDEAKRVVEYRDKHASRTHVYKFNKSCADKAKLSGGAYLYTESYGEWSVSVDELKSLVEGHELVGNIGGIKRAKRILKKSYASFNTMVSFVWNDKPFQCTLEQLEQAIADVESCHVD